MFKASLFIALILVSASQSHILSKRFFFDGSIFGTITNTIDQQINSIKSDLDKFTNDLQNALSLYKGTFESALQSFSSGLSAFLTGYESANSFIKQVEQTINTLSSKYPYEIFDDPKINLPFMKACVKAAYEPTQDNQKTCLNMMFPDLQKCVDASLNPTYETIMKCTNSLNLVNEGSKYCLDLVSQPTEDNFVGCSQLVANMLVPNSGAPLSIYQQCKTVASDSSYNTISKCSLEVLNSIQSSTGVTFPFINNVQAINECVQANAQTPQNVLQNCANILSQTLNLGPLQDLLTGFNQCRLSNAPISTCVGQLLEKEKTMIPFLNQLTNGLNLLKN